ncbi:MAG TPA: hypothetical protein VNE39_10855 [Planctomycetota bacterium]|nr:hypothetical protein [Planctomycetota bacterium]
MMEHRQCDVCGGYISRRAAICPACGNPMPGRLILRALLGVFLIAGAATALIALALWLWAPTVKFLGDTAAHDARMGKALLKEQRHDPRAKGGHITGEHAAPDSKGP